MKVKTFIERYRPFALASEAKTGIHNLFTLAHAAVETGWGESAPGNMMFGVKDTDGVNGNEQLITTTEYSMRSDLKFPVIIKKEQVVKSGRKMWKYTVKDYFRKYDTPEQSFTDHNRFFLSNARYAEALKVKSDPVAFARAIAKAGYATDPGYADLLISVIKTLQKNLK